MDNAGLMTILLDKYHLTVGETVTLFCHGLTTSATDWIGLFYEGNLRLYLPITKVSNVALLKCNNRKKAIYNKRAGTPYDITIVCFIVS